MQLGTTRRTPAQFRRIRPGFGRCVNRSAHAHPPTIGSQASSEAKWWRRSAA
jgi:hypothetical protein